MKRTMVTDSCFSNRGILPTQKKPLVVKIAQNLSFHGYLSIIYFDSDRWLSESDCNVKLWWFNHIYVCLTVFFSFFGVYTTCRTPVDQTMSRRFWSQQSQHLKISKYDMNTFVFYIVCHIMQILQIKKNAKLWESKKYYLW